jgi:hypothetical protein
MANPQSDAPREPTHAELRDRVVNARSVLGDAPLYRAVRKALAALDGASLEDLAAGHVEHEHPAGDEPREYLRGWQDGYDAGYVAGAERRDGTAA